MRRRPRKKNNRQCKKETKEKVAVPNSDECDTVTTEKFADLAEFSLNYEFLEKVAEGSYSSVILCTHKTSNKLFAAKVTFSYSKWDIELESECELLKMIRHPNIIKMHNCYLNKGLLSIIVMDFIRGETLTSLLDDWKFFPSEMNAKFVMRGLLSALQYLHEKRIVHRDIHPGNIIVDTRGSELLDIKLIDFGNADIGDRFRLETGNKYYGAPEMDGLNYYNHKVDVFAAGINMISCLSILTLHEVIFMMKIGKIGEIKLVPCRREAADLIVDMIRRRPNQRISAEDALKHKWFRL